MRFLLRSHQSFNAAEPAYCVLDKPNRATFFSNSVWMAGIGRNLPQFGFPLTRFFSRGVDPSMAQIIRATRRGEK